MQACPAECDLLRSAVFADVSKRYGHLLILYTQPDLAASLQSGKVRFLFGPRRCGLRLSKGTPPR